MLVNFISNLLINGPSRAHKLFGEILKKYNFWPISVKIVAPPSDIVQNNTGSLKANFIL